MGVGIAGVGVVVGFDAGFGDGVGARVGFGAGIVAGVAVGINVGDGVGVINATGGTVEAGADVGWEASSASTLA